MRGEVTVVDGVLVHRLAAPMPGRLPVNPFAAAELRRRLVDGAFDVAHLQTGVVSPFVWDATRVTLGIGLPTAMTWHCMLAGMAPVFGAARFVHRWAARGVAMPAVSAVAAQPLRRLVGPDAPVNVLPNGIDVGRWAVGTVAREPGPLRLVTAMRLAARKRPVALLDLVAAAVRESGPGTVTLTVLGEGTHRRRMEAVIRGRGLDWVSLPGRVSRDELREAYAAADVYLSPTRLEAFGIAALEARTVGLPVIGRSGSGMGEFVTHAVNGLVVQCDSHMSSEIARLVREPDEVARMRAWNASHPPEQEWSRVAALAVGEYERAGRLSRP